MAGAHSSTGPTISWPACPGERCHHEHHEAMALPPRGRLPVRGRPLESLTQRSERRHTRHARVVAIEPTGEPGRSRRRSKQITAIDQDRRGADEPHSLRLGLVSHHPGAEPHVGQASLVQGLPQDHCGPIFVGAVNNDQQLHIHTPIIAPPGVEQISPTSRCVTATDNRMPCATVAVPLSFGS